MDIFNEKLSININDKSDNKNFVVVEPLDQHNPNLHDDATVHTIVKNPAYSISISKDPLITKKSNRNNFRQNKTI